MSLKLYAYVAARFSVVSFLGIFLTKNERISKFGFTAAPIVLGLILGPIAETNFSQAKIIADRQEGIFRYLTSGYLNLTIITHENV